jgi:predicted RNase H-like nuclease
MRHRGGVFFVGVDLAWGKNRPTGVAILDANGGLNYVGAALHDGEIIDAVSPYVQGECLVAIDAPLIVTNNTGQRPAERALNADFGGFDAGAHSANLGIAVFSSGLRGARIAGALGLDMDPCSTASRRAIEVYPHPATIALFRLGRTLKYKHKPKRSFGLLQSELLRLIRLIEDLADADVGMRVAENSDWARLRQMVETATTKAELRRAEDPVDAVVCAYIARYATDRPGSITIYGDFDTGYILTPTLPTDLGPAPRQLIAEPADAQEADFGLLEVSRAAKRLEVAQAALQEAVAQFREHGGSWAVIGEVLGVPEDEAKRRFG